jgi:hypothetical protein
VDAKKRAETGIVISPCPIEARHCREPRGMGESRSVHRIERVTAADLEHVGGCSSAASPDVPIMLILPVSQGDGCTNAPLVSNGCNPQSVEGL